MRNQSFLDPVVIAQLGNLHLQARRILDGLYSGHHVNLNRGHSQDFSEHRPYNPGDDLRGLDWKIFGRTDRLVVKQYEEQTNIGATVLLDDSASMNFSWAGRPSKLAYAKMMAAALGYLVVSQHDAIGFLSSGKYLPPGSHRSHLDLFFEQLEAAQGKGIWSIDELSATFGSRIKRRGFVMVFSDLMQNEDKVIATLRSLQARKYEVLVFQILDPAERDLPFDGPILFEDMETGEKLKTEPDAIRQQYRRWVEAKIKGFTQVFQSSGIDYLMLTTDTPFDKGLGAYLSWRGARL